MTKQNLHTHTTYCDGKDSPREILEMAIQKGFAAIGFSGHSWMAYSPGHSMSIEGTQDYIREIRSLKEEYAGRIGVFCGIEYDMLSDIDISAFDYRIGSCHYFLLDGTYVGFDRSQAEVARVIEQHFGGDGMAYAKEYYRCLAKLPEYGSFDIIGHFDLIAKHCENIRFYDEDSRAYHTWATEAAEALAGKIPFFEVNTGAIARGYRTTPYPSIPILRELRRLGYGAVITSDCHDGAMLDCAFDDAAELLRTCGFREHFLLTDAGFVPEAL